MITEFIKYNESKILNTKFESNIKFGLEFIFNKCEIVKPESIFEKDIKYFRVYGQIILTYLFKSKNMDINKSFLFEGYIEHYVNIKGFNPPKYDNNGERNYYLSFRFKNKEKEGAKDFIKFLADKFCYYDNKDLEKKLFDWGENIVIFYKEQYDHLFTAIDFNIT